jgi:hypothetical protein
LNVLLGAAERRQDQRGLAAGQMGPVDLGRDLHSQPRTAQGRSRDVGVGCSLHEVSAQTKKDLGAAIT